VDVRFCKRCIVHFKPPIRKHLRNKLKNAEKIPRKPPYSPELRGNEPSSNPPKPSEKRADPDEIVRIL
jgi:hypothetical protein